MKKYLLGIDNGGTNIKAALFDFEGKQLSVVRHPSCTMYCGDGRVELDQEKLWAANCRCIRDLIALSGVQPGEIACIGFAGQGKGLYMVDEQECSFRRAITSSDGRADGICASWRSEGTADHLFPKLYQLPMAGQTAPLLRWLKENEPDHYARIGAVFSMKDFLVLRMTGKRIAGRSAQSGTMLVNLNTGEYDDELLQSMGIEELADRLPPLKWDAELCGGVQDSAADACGCAAGTPACAGMFDVNASALAMGIVQPGQMFMILGTCGINGYISKRPIADHSVSYNSLYPLPGMYLIEEGSNASSGVLEWVLELFFGKERDDRIFGRVNAMVDSVAAERSSLIFLPTLSGFTHGSSKGSMRSRGAWIGMNPGHGRAEMLRAVYEGVAFIHRIEVEDLLKSRPAPDRIRVAGSATRSNVWMQMLADVLQLPLEIVDDGEIGARGAAITAAVAAGIYPDLPTAVRKMTQPGRLIMPQEGFAGIYESKYRRFCRVMDMAAPMWEQMQTEE